MIEEMPSDGTFYQTGSMFIEVSFYGCEWRMLSSFKVTPNGERFVIICT